MLNNKFFLLDIYVIQTLSFYIHVYILSDSNIVLPQSYFIANRPYRLTLYYICKICTTNIGCINSLFTRKCIFTNYQI